MKQTREAIKPKVISSFGEDSPTGEYFVALHAPAVNVFSAALDSLLDEYEKTLSEAGLSEDTTAFTRVYLSDIANQKDDLLSSQLFKHLRSGAVSVVEQGPVGEGPIAILSYHIKNSKANLPRELLNHDPQAWRNGNLIKGNNYKMLWTAGYDGRGEFDSYGQTKDLFNKLTSVLDTYGMTLLDNTVRTWVYVRDIDNHYKGMVDARREYFIEQGLTPETRYIASTGIEGKSRTVDSLLTVDSLSIGGLVPEQIVRMEALENLSPTIKYGVTFERGTRIRFGDRSHFHISGTASIDKHGDVLHLGDVEKQAERTIDNVEALLSPHGADLNDMRYLLVYLRDVHAMDTVENIVRKRVPEHVPVLYLKGPVCRPTWLVEMEGVGIAADDTKYPPFI